MEGFYWFKIHNDNIRTDDQLVAVLDSTFSLVPVLIYLNHHALKIYYLTTGIKTNTNLTSQPQFMSEFGKHWEVFLFW